MPTDVIYFPSTQPTGPTCKHGIAAGHCPDCPTDRAWLCALSKDAEDWYWGGATRDDAVNAGVAIIVGEAVDGFWIAPAHRSTSEDDHPEHDYTVESDKAEWIPLH